jgi:hypothetical protein
VEEIGEFITFSPDEGDFELGLKATMCKIIKANGIPLDELTLSIISKFAKQDATRVKKQTMRGGLPSSLKILFSLKDKNDVMNWIKNMVITKDCLSNLILNCHKLGLTHKRKHTQFLTPSTTLSTEEKKAFADYKTGKLNDAGIEKALRKLSTAYKERKFSTAHLFENGQEWHLIYFDYNDLYIPKGDNHHKRGPHMHYISYLWGNHQKDKLWEQFESRYIKINSEHIRFIEKDCGIKQKRSTGKCRLERIKPQHFLKVDNDMLCYGEEASINLKPNDIHIKTPS